MGGPITATVTARHFESVDKLVLIDPVGARPIPLARILNIASAPFVGELLLSLVGSRGSLMNFATKLFGEEIDPGFLEKYMPQTHYKGFRRAILSTIRNHMLNTFMDVYRRVGALNKPVRLIWGRQDTTVPFSHSEDLLAAIPQIELQIVEDGTHIPHYEKPAEIHPLLLEFLRRP
jgi:pimeloyl-ACP methyl ester carboxylesterase